MSSMRFSVGVVGVGCVGSAVLKYYENRNDVYAVGYDKYKDGYNAEQDFKNLLNQDFLFLCLPTLYSDEKKEYNKTAIHDVCKRLDNENYSGLVVLKSTVEPGTTELLSTVYENLDLAHNPEFLTARTAFKDFENQPRIVIGKPTNTSERKCRELESLMRLCWPKAVYSMSSSTESETMKSFCNCFYAMKISIFNEFYVMCKEKGMNFEKVKEMMLLNGW
jgi:UDP-glucose 6-dehydrogenase